MDEVTIVKNEIKKAEWATKIQKCQASGLTIAEWCRQNGINPKAYYYQLRKAREKAIEQIPVPIGMTPQTAVYQEQSNPTIEIQIGKAIVKIPDGMSEQTINAVMRALK